MMTLWLLGFIVHLAFSSVTQKYSQVIDRFDVEGKTEIPLTKCYAGCTVYVSISAANKPEDANHLVIYKTPRTNMTLQYPIGTFAVQGQKDGWKLPIQKEEIGEFVIGNSDVTKTGIPILIYTVSYLGQVTGMVDRVYEARLYNKAGIDENLPLTIMSADPFTVQKVQIDGSVEIYASGYDVLLPVASKDCFPLYSGQDAHSLAPIPFPTPLMTISSKSNFKNITVSMGIDPNVILNYDQNSAIISPGYHGCGGTERYRYKETDDPINYVVQLRDFGSGKSANFSLYSDILTGLNVLDSPVVLEPSTGGTVSMWGDVNHRFQTYTLQAQWIKVNSPPLYPSISFAMRVGFKLNKPGTVAPSTTTVLPETTTKAAAIMVNIIQFLIISFFITLSHL